MEIEKISSEEIILRRIPPPEDENTLPLPEGGRRANSFTLQLRDGETGLSCTRLKTTSPKDLLAQLSVQGIPKDGWMVCRMLTADVRSLGLDVIHDPQDSDHGHCEIRVVNGTFTKKCRSNLAKRTRILTSKELECVSAGDTIS